MRLHALRLTAVGPFAGEERIDFDRLSSGGLFLFEGPTGVGKSTVLDALTFALYGGLASESGDPARMRSDFADPQARPEVELELSVRGRRYRITRSPEYLRPKLRGSGVTREKSSVHLQRRDTTGWTSLSHAKDEVGGLVTELIGLTREQFRQVVVLPQGEFATFLRADDDRRRDVLATLFGARFFGRVAEQLQAQAGEARADRSRVESDLDARVAAAEEAAGIDPADHAALRELPAGERVDALATLGSVLRSRASRTEEWAATADAEESAARTAHVAAQRSFELVRRRTSLHAELACLLADRAAQEAREERLAEALRAEPVRPLLELATRHAARVEQATRDAGRLGIDGAERVGRVDADAAERTSRQLRHEADGLSALVEVEAGLHAAAAAHAAEERRLDQVRRARDRALERATALPEMLRSARAEHQDALQAAGTAAAAELRLARADDGVRAAARLAQLDADLVRLRVELRHARRASDAAAHELELVAAQRWAGLRAELAERLVSGDPCLVCGSVEHPAPALPGTAQVTEAALQDATRRFDEERVLLAEVEVAEARLAGERTPLVAKVQGCSVAQWQLQSDDAAADVARAAAAAAEVPALLAAVVALEADAEAVAAERLSLVEQLASAEADVERGRSTLAEASALVEAGRGDHPTVTARVAALQAAAGASDERARAILAVEAARAERDAVWQQVTAETSDLGFADPAAAEAAILASGERTELTRLVAAWRNDVEGVRAQLDAEEFAAVAALDGAAADAAVRRAEAALADSGRTSATARREATIAQRTSVRFADRMDEVTAAAERLAQVSAQAEEIIALDAYARGIAGNPRMTLATYVLRHWFEKVVAAANLRLDVMSSGKYQLLRTDEAARRDARVGLGLAVLDRHTGRERGPRTLSGGETFYTALALALGLADVVVAEAGGAQLDTLFIDEGFGSLDADTLDEVLGVIDDLRGSGRVVGIVSHVPDLKERITERLSVRRVRPDGPSRIEVIA